MCGKQTGDGHGRGREVSLEAEVARSADRPPVVGQGEAPRGFLHPPQNP